MADSELIDLTNDAAPASTNLYYSVRDPSGTPVDRKVTQAALATALAADSAFTTAFLAAVDGTWTPTITAGSGTFTTVSASGAYTTHGNLVTMSIDIQITTNGTAATSIIATLPFTAAAGSNWSLPGREYQSTGNVVNGYINGSGTTITIRSVTNTYPGASGYRFTVSGVYKK